MTASSAPRSVLDASALLAFMQKESGWESLRKVIGRAAMSAVNWSEVVGKAIERKAPLEGLREDVESAGIQILPFTTEEAEIAAGMRTATQSLGLSLGDRAALALARRLNLPVYTTDRTWGRLSVGVRVRVVR